MWRTTTPGQPTGPTSTCEPASGAPARDVAVVLVHGYLCSSRLLYWQGLRPLRRALAARGCPVVHSCQPSTGSVATRAQHLSRSLAALPYRRLILVGHSMGGLDARYVASRLDPKGRISHVVTLGTPHRGSALADWAMRDRGWRQRLVRLIDRGALADLSLARAERLNEAMPDRPDVTYVSLAGACGPDRLIGGLRLMAERLALDEGPNDGLVALRSALRGDVAITLAANHMELIGHWPSARAGLRPGRLPQPLRALQAILAHSLTDSLPIRGSEAG